MKTLKGYYFPIKSTVKEKVNASGYEQRWFPDPKGYFLIRINRQKKTLEVGHCTNDHKLVHVISGKTPENVMYKTIDKGFLSRLDHAAYLGKELQKAYIALKHNFTYIQDSELVKGKNK